MVSVRFLVLCSCAALLAGCHRASPHVRPDGQLLQVITISSEANAAFETDFYRDFAARHRIEVKYLGDPGGKVDDRLKLYRQFFQKRSSRPDMIAIDVVWPAILADHLVDLRPILGHRLRSFSPGLLQTFTVNGRLVALPTFTDAGLLYYRADLLAKYGFRKPPATWDELGSMALVIQDGERRRGNQDFWGFTWQGGASEALTCNAIEWQASAGAGEIISRNGRLELHNPAFLNALARSARWIGTISPPGQYLYREMEGSNLWIAGQVAFMRHWATSYNALTQGLDPKRFGIAPLPAGPGGHAATLGGQGIAISKYAANPEMAIKALLELTSEATDLARVLKADSLPVHLLNQNRPEVRRKSKLHAASAELMRNLTLRPAAFTGSRYDQVSIAYYTAVNRVLRRQQQPAEAMAALETTLQNILR